MTGMPLVVVSGIPSSGKTRRVQELVEFLGNNCDREVHVISDDFSRVAKNELYGSSQLEKTARGELKSGVERHLTPERVVILDSLNYIKGFRYELFCVSKHVKTPHCVMQCDTASDTAREWNRNRENTDERYSDPIFDALVMRFEPPDSRNRWDSPLFVIHPDDPLPAADILAALLDRKPPPPNQSTQTQPLSATSFLHELDRKTQEIVRGILEAQRAGVPGDVVAIPGSSETLRLPRLVTMAELRRLRRQFIAYTKLHPTEECDKIPTLFVQYLSSTL